MEDFELDPTLAADTFPVATLGLCRLLLMNDSRFPWLILVPQRAGMVDMHDLSPLDQTMLTFETLPTRIARNSVPVIVRQMEPEKLLQALKLAASNAPDTLEFFYANISKRMVEQYQEQIQDLGPVRKRDAEAAQAAMMSLIARLEKEGEIELIRQEVEAEDEEERI